jgi:hypothetical protein
MGKAEPAEEVVTALKKRSRLRRIPTSLVVTVVGIALTAWLLPALTRQWDDRQKAQELRAALVSQMARASANVIVGSRHPIIRASPKSQAALERALDDWELHGVEIEEKLSAYFPRTVAMEWHSYRLLVEGVFGAWQLQERGAAHPNQVAISDREVSGDFRQGLDSSDSFLSPKRHQLLEDVVDGQTEERPAYERRLVRTIAFVDVERTLLEAEHMIATHLLAANPQGYSTTWKDFLRDLIP